MDIAKLDVNYSLNKQNAPKVFECILFYQRESAISKINFSVFSQPKQGSVID